MVLFLSGVFVLVTGIFFSLDLIRQNLFCGFRNRWTLSDSSVWHYTNRFCGEFLVLWGAILICCHNLSQTQALWWLLVPVFLLILMQAVFSAVVYYRKWNSFTVVTPALTSSNTFSYSHNSDCSDDPDLSNNSDSPDNKASWSPSLSTNEMIAEFVIILIPLVFLFLSIGKVIVPPRYVPVVFSVTGRTIAVGAGESFFKIYLFAFVFALLTYFGHSRQLRLPSLSSSFPSSFLLSSYSSVRWAFYFIRLGAVTSIVGYGVSSWLIGAGFLLNPYSVLFLPLCFFAGGGLFLISIFRTDVSGTQ